MSPFVKNDDYCYHLLRCSKCDFGEKKKSSGLYKVYQTQGKLYLVCKRCKTRFEFHTNL